MATETWDNKLDMGIRTKLGLQVLMLMFRIIAPYQFGHQYEAELSALIKELEKI